MPVRSTRAPRSACVSRISARAATSVPIPTGTLIRKIGRQLIPNRSASTSAPPSSGPPTVAIPIEAPKMPNALGRSSGGNAAVIVDSTCGTISAAIAPCSTRAPINISGVTATPHSTDAMVNPPTPIRKIRRRPKTSPSRPPVISPTANGSV